MANVIFKMGSKAQYDALAVKDANTLYWLSDVQELRKGDVLYGKGKDATNLASGLMSAADKQKLDSLSAAAAPEYSIEKQVTADGSSVATYKLKKVVDGETTYVGDAINIPADMVVQGGTVEKVTTADQPYEGAKVGDTYIDIVLSDASSSHIYIPAADLFTPNTAGDGLGIDGSKISIKVDNENANGLTVGPNGLAMGLATTEKAGAMSAVDKVALDTLSADMVQVKADIEQMKTTGGVGGIVWETI